MSGALRLNEGKPSLAYMLQFVNPMRAIARIMEFGAAKYEDGNWRKGGKPDREYLDSMMRHLTYWLHGEVYDDDSGCSHLGHAIWNMLALHELNHPDEIMDDEVFKKQCAYWKAKKEEKKDQEEDKVPRTLQHGSFISKEKAEKGMEDLKAMNDEEWEEKAELSFVAHRGGGVTIIKDERKPAAEFKMEKKPWTLPPVEVFTEPGEERAKVICGETRQAAKVIGQKLRDEVRKKLTQWQETSEEVLAEHVKEVAVTGEGGKAPLVFNSHPVFCACDVCMESPPVYDNTTLTDTDKVEGHEEFNDKMFAILRGGLLNGPTVREWTNALKRVNDGKYPTTEELAKAHQCKIPAEYCDDSPPLEENVVLTDWQIEPADWQIEEVQKVRDEARNSARVIGKGIRETLKRTPKQDKGKGPACPECGSDTSSFRATWECKCGWWDYKADSCLTKKTACSDEGVCEEPQQDIIEIEFTLDDVDRCESFGELVQKYLRPAIVKQALRKDAEWLKAYEDFFEQLDAATSPPKPPKKKKKVKKKSRNLLEGAPVTLTSRPPGRGKIGGILNK